jgi:hypothetical protein
MSYRSLALAVTALSSMHVASADAQSVYVAPGGVYIGAGPVYVIPAPNHNGNGNGPYVAPTYGYDYPPPAVVAPVPPVVAPTIYGPNGHYNGRYDGHYYGPKVRYYEPPPLSVYGATELPPPRPPVAVPYNGRGYVNGRYGYDPRWQTPY